jgi:hypothetical protein
MAVVPEELAAWVVHDLVPASGNVIQYVACRLAEYVEVHCVQIIDEGHQYAISTAVLDLSITLTRREGAAR